MLKQLRAAGLLAQRQLHRHAHPNTAHLGRAAAPIPLPRCRPIATAAAAATAPPQQPATTPTTAATTATPAAAPGSKARNHMVDPDTGFVNWERLDRMRIYFRGSTMGWRKQRVAFLQSNYKIKGAGTAHVARFYAEYVRLVQRNTPPGQPLPVVPLRGLLARAPNPCPQLNCVEDPNFPDWLIGYIEAQTNAFQLGPHGPFLRLGCNDNFLNPLKVMNFERYGLRLGTFCPAQLTLTVTDPHELRVVAALCDGNLRLPSSRARFAAWVAAFNAAHPQLAWAEAEGEVEGEAEAPAVKRQEPPSVFPYNAWMAGFADFDRVQLDADVRAARSGEHMSLRVVGSLEVAHPDPAAARLFWLAFGGYGELRSTPDGLHRWRAEGSAEQLQHIYVYFHVHRMRTEKRIVFVQWVHLLFYPVEKALRDAGRSARAFTRKAYLVLKRQRTMQHMEALRRARRDLLIAGLYEERAHVETVKGLLETPNLDHPLMVKLPETGLSLKGVHPSKPYVLAMATGAKPPPEEGDDVSDDDDDDDDDNEDAAAAGDNSTSDGAAAGDK